jgi:hypothetical protein
MDFVQQGRGFLYFIEHDPSALGSFTDERLEPMGISGQLEIQRGVQEVQVQRLR